MYEVTASLLKKEGEKLYGETVSEDKVADATDRVAAAIYFVGAALIERLDEIASR